MFDWRLEEENEQLGDHQGLEGSGSLIGRRWKRVLVLLFIACAGLAAGGWGLVRWQVAERERTLKEDLTAFILFEEQVRRAGSEFNAQDLIAPGAPQDWQERYLQTLGGDLDVSPEVTILSLDFDGFLATVLVRVEGLEQLRSYRLWQQRWLRAPATAEAWGEIETIRLPHDIRLEYRQRDAAFAAALSQDMPALFALWEALPGWPELTRISIQPHEFAAPVLFHEAGDLGLNSPLAQMAYATDDAAAQVRGWLAQASLAPMLHEPVRRSRLPGVSFVGEAAQHVLAAGWASLSAPDSNQDWLQDALANGWTSPFFDLEPGTAEASGLRQRRRMAAAYVLMDYVYGVFGLEAIGEIVRQLPQASTWDQVFVPTTGMVAYALEELAWADFRGSALASPPAASLAVPEEVVLLETGAPSRLSLLVQAPYGLQTAGGSNNLLVDLSVDLRLEAEDGSLVTLTCIGPGSRLAVEGEWQEVGRRLRATRLVIREARLPEGVVVQAAPPDTVAFVVGEAADLQGAARVYEPFMDWRATAAERARRMDAYGLALYALTASGDLVRLANTGLKVDAAEQAARLATLAPPERRLYFVLSPLISDCNRAWILLYDPEQGLAGKWLAPPAAPANSGLIVRPQSAEILVWQGPEFLATTGLQRAGQSLLLEPVWQIGRTFTFQGWSQASGQMFITTQVAGERQLGLVDIGSGDVQLLSISQQVASGFQSSSDGQWLAYLVEHPERGDEPSAQTDLTRAVPRCTRHAACRLMVQDLQSGETRELKLPEAFRMLNLEAAPPGLPERRLVVQALHVAYGTVNPVLLMIAPGRASAQAVTVLAEGRQGESLGLPVFCPDGAMLYRVLGLNDMVTLRAQRPGPGVSVQSPRGYAFRHFPALHDSPQQPVDILSVQASSLHPIACTSALPESWWTP